MSDLVEQVARALYEAHHNAGPFADEPIEWGRGGYKTQVAIWHAVARAALSVLEPRIEALEAENFKLAAGACTVEGGLIGDDHGHFDCSLKARIEALERELAEAVAAERERCAAIAEKWRDENKAAAARARKRTRALAGSPFQDPSMGDMLEGAAIECDAIAAAIRNGERG
jgi:hypothetical protein